MLVLSTLSSLLAQLVTPSLHTAILSTPQGHLVAFACDDIPVSEDRLRILVGLTSELWRDDDTGSVEEEEEISADRQHDPSSEEVENSDDQVGMLECELGRLLVLPIYALSPENKTPSETSEPQPVLLLSLNGVIDEPWGLMHTKARAVNKYLQDPLRTVGDRLIPSSSPSRLRATAWAR
ncbi:hypothetical protein FRB94_010662 [Tulasnella sp. JGI-2019a]|nr:hypothetical protein FRB94_010662 [Tulasnella sp. JGI-2019a]